MMMGRGPGPGPGPGPSSGPQVGSSTELCGCGFGLRALDFGAPPSPGKNEAGAEVTVDTRDHGT